MRILIVDDDATSRAPAQGHRDQVRSRRAWWPRTARAGGSCSPTAASTCCLTDWMMPGTGRARAVPPRAQRTGRPLHLHRLDDGARPSRAHLGRHERRRRRLSDEAGRLLRGADPPRRGRAGHRAASQARLDPGESSSGPTSSCWSNHAPTNSPVSGNRRRMEEDLARTHARAMRRRPHLRRRALRHRLLQVLQRSLRPCRAATRRCGGWPHRSTWWCGRASAPTATAARSSCSSCRTAANRLDLHHR